MGNERYQRLKSNLNRLQIDIAAKKIINKEIPLDGDILDINASGIKVKLAEPLGSNIDGRIIIHLTMPVSGSKMTIHGTLDSLQRVNSVQNNDDEKASIDDLVHQCIILSETTLLIKTI